MPPPDEPAATAPWLALLEVQEGVPMSATELDVLLGDNCLLRDENGRE